MIIDRAKIEAALPHYELGEEIGRGGFGLVFSARHRKLGLLRAVKAIVIAPADLAQVSSRFLTEAQVMTELDHPHIVRVHEYAEQDTVRLLVMEHLAGGTLADRLAGPTSPAMACAWGLAVADALQAAHDRGVLHRDIKPDNLLFTAGGLLKVTDFGIAKLFDGTEISASLNVLGTPLYISPEQITSDRLSPSTDLYALGVTLYQLLTRRTPFPSGLQFTALLLHHLNEPPAPLDDAPPHIAAVVLRALSKNPADRQASAREFAVDLARAATADLGPGWIGRSGVPLRLDSAVLDVAVSPPGPVPRQPGRASVSPVTPKPGPVTPQPGRASVGRVTPQSGPVTPSDWPVTPSAGPVPPQPGRASVVPVTPPSDPASAGPATLQAGPVTPPPIVVLRPPTGSGAPPADRPRRGRRAVVAGIVAIVLVVAVGLTIVLARNLTSGPGSPTSSASTAAAQPAVNATTARVIPVGGTVRSVAFSPNGKTLASGSEDHTVGLWTVATGASVRTLTGHANWVLSVAFSPDGKTLASGSGDNTVRLWNGATGAHIRTLTGHTNWVLSVAFSRDGKTLTSASTDRTVREWNPATGAPLNILPSLSNYVWSVTFSPDGSTVACAGEDGTIMLWKPGSGAEPRKLTGHTGRVLSVAFSPDGKTLASASDDHSIRLWDPRTGRLLRTLTGHTGGVYSVAFSPDGKTLASGSDDHTVRFWDPQTGKLLRTLTGHSGRVWSVAFSSDGKTLASGGADRTIRIWALT
jgi:serine/threonine protein kinase/Tol biopolymer transport system component